MEKNEIIDNIDEYYTKDVLVRFANFFDSGSVTSLKKKTLIEKIVGYIGNESMFKQFYTQLSESGKIVIDHLTWWGPSSIRALGDLYGTSIDINDRFIKALWPYYPSDIQFSTGFRVLFKCFIEKPIEGFLYDTQNEETFLGSDNVIYELEAISDFIQENGIRDRELEKKLLIKPLKAFSKKFNFAEPFEDYTVARSLITLFRESPKGKNPIETIQQILKKYRNGDLFPYHNIDKLLSYPDVRGFSSVYNIDIFLKRGRAVFIDSIKSIGESDWISTDRLVVSTALDEVTEIFDTTYFGRYLYEKTENYYYDYFDNKFTAIDKLFNPMLKGIINILFSFGAVDIKLRGTFPSAFRLNQLGLKLLGLPSSYKIRSIEEFNYKFHDSRLLITTEGHNSSLINFFKRISLDLGDGGFLVTNTTIMQECDTHNDLEANLTRLEKLLPKKKLSIWSDFIEQQQDRMEAVLTVEDRVVIEFDGENRDLIDLITSNSKIRILYDMVDGFKGSFSKINYNKFRKLLKEHGFLI